MEGARRRPARPRAAAESEPVPCAQPQDLARVIPELDADGIDLMASMLHFDPAKRIHATEARMEG